MSNGEAREIYIQAIEKWGILPQVLMVMEECGELLSALSKFNRRRVNSPEVITELADVSIMVEQMASYFGWENFWEERDRKLQRLKERIKK